MNRRTLIKGFATLFGVLSLTGCATLKIVGEGAIKEGEIRKLMAQNNISGFSELVFDEEYAVVTLDWINNVFCPALKEEAKKYNLDYQFSSFDCDNFSGMGRYVASRLNNKTINKGLRGIAIGEFLYRTDSNINHAINFAVIRGANGLELIFVEPQNSRIIKLSKSELNACLVWMI